MTTPTTIANLALLKINEKGIDSIDDTGDPRARKIALVYEPTLREVLRAHFWGFALCTRPLVAVDTRVYLSVTGPLMIGSTDLEFPRLYLAQDEFNSHVRFDEELDADDITSTASTVFWADFDDCWLMRHGATSATWKRGIDVASPELTTFRPSSPNHFLVTALTGADNDLHFEQKEQHLAPVTIQYNAPAGSVSTVSASGRDITVTPSLRSRINVAGTLTPDLAGDLFEFGTNDGKPQYGRSSVPPAYGGALMQWSAGSGKWVLTEVSEEGSLGPGTWTKTSAAGTPVGLTGWDNIFSTGDLVVTNPGSVAASAYEIQNAIQDDGDAAALVGVTIASGSDGSGSVTAMPRTALAGGLTGTPMLQRVDPSTELLGWTHAFPLPDDCIRTKNLFPVAGGRKIEKFAIRRVAGDTCILCNFAAVSLEYVQFVDEIDEWDAAFTEAFVTLLASRLARSITGSEKTEADLRLLYEQIALPGARTSDAQETQSGENRTPLDEFISGNLLKFLQ